MAVRVAPVPKIAPSVPPDTEMSEAVKLAPGSSLNAKVMVAVSPAFSALLSLEIARVGARVSMASVPDRDAAPPALPAAS